MHQVAIVQDKKLQRCWSAETEKGYFKQ